MNIPNLITVIRILLVPLLAIFLLEEQYGYALLVFIIAGVSDALDGFLARLLKQRTRLGAILDPLADKALLITSFIILAVIGVIPQWLAVLVVSRDLIILIGFGVLVLTNSKLEIAPTWTGKLTTVSQLTTVAYFLGLEYILFLFFIRNYLLAATAILTLLSCVQYMAIGFRALAESQKENNSGKISD